MYNDILKCLKATNKTIVIQTESLWLTVLLCWRYLTKNKCYPITATIICDEVTMRLALKYYEVGQIIINYYYAI